MEFWLIMLRIIVPRLVFIFFNNVRFFVDVSDIFAYMCTFDLRMFITGGNEVLDSLIHVVAYQSRDSYNNYSNVNDNNA